MDPVLADTIKTVAGMVVGSVLLVLVLLVLFGWWAYLMARQSGE